MHLRCSQLPPVDPNKRRSGFLHAQNAFAFQFAGMVNVLRYEPVGLYSRGTNGGLARNGCATLRNNGSPNPAFPSWRELLFQTIADHQNLVRKSCLVYLREYWQNGISTFHSAKVHFLTSISEDLMLHQPISKEYKPCDLQSG